MAELNEAEHPLAIMMECRPQSECLTEMENSLPTTAPLTIELIADDELGGFTARLPDIPAYGEGATEQEAIEDLRKALVGYIETFGVDDALCRISRPQLRQVEWSLAEMASE